MVEIQKFETGTRYGLEILHQCGRKLKTKSQKKFLEGNSYVCRSYREKTGRVGGGVFLHPAILNRVNNEDRKGFLNKEKMLKFTKLCSF